MRQIEKNVLLKSAVRALVIIIDMMATHFVAVCITPTKIRQRHPKKNSGIL